MIRIAKVALFCCISSGLPLAAQAPAFDTSGNGMLHGTYYFRHVLYAIGTTADSNGIIGDISEAIALYGHITFDGNGNYTIPDGIVSDSGVGSPDPLSCYLAQTTCTTGAAVAGTYSVSASGYGALANPIATGDFIYGLVSANGIFAGSSTETTFAYNDLFIGAPVPSPGFTNSNFQGAYTVAGYLPLTPVTPPGLAAVPGEDMFLQMSPDGNGNLSNVNVTGYYAGGGTNAISQSNSSVKYFFSNSAAVVTFPTSSSANFFSGEEYLYFSPDGNFFFGGSPTDGYDMIVGVRNASGTQNFQGLYYQAGIDQNLSDLSGGYADFDGYYGSLNASGNGSIIAHERLADIIFAGSTYDWTFADSFTPPVTGAYTDTNESFQYAVGDGGAIRIGQGIGPYLGLSVAFQAPSFPGTQPVYINPTGVVNAASSAPFTAGIANGEFISIYGTGLASGTALASSLPIPTKLNGVQVTINGVSAPVDYVSPGQLNVIVPAQDPYSLAQIQVINNSGSSNVVTVPLNPASPGVYANPSGGVYAAAIDSNSGQLVTPSTPAQPGDTLEVFATGLGVVSPPVTDGNAPPDSPLSYTYNTITADLDGSNSATVSFAGLAPGLAGLYQINVQIPSTTTAGDHLLDISASNPSTTALESYSQQILVSVGAGTAATAGTSPVASARARHRRVDSSYLNRTRLCLPGTKPACQK